MRSTFLLGMTILMLVVPAVHHSAAEEELNPSYQGEMRPRRNQPSAPSRTLEKSKARRRPVVPLELPAELGAEMAEGLSLDDALQRLLVANRDLAIKSQAIPKARADVLSAGLIENPAIFLDSEGIPYGNYSEQRPGETSYEATIIFPPLDVSGKRRQRLLVARRAEKVLEALYQEAVRQEVDKLYSAYVDVLEAAIKRAALQQAAQPAREKSEATVRRAYTEIALREAEANLLQAQRELALRLAIPAEQAGGLMVRGPLRDQAPLPPTTEELISLALQTRPDLAAFQLSVEQAQANVQLSRAEAWEDMLLFYTPYQVITFPAQGKQTATAWEAGGLAVVPIFDRNQGNIARARINRTQLQIQVRGLREQVIREVQHAAAEYALTRQLVQKYESTLLPRAPHDLNYDETIQHYLDALVNHRRSMLRLNTAVGQRILP